MPFGKLSCVLLIITCLFIAGCGTKVEPPPPSNPVNTELKAEEPPRPGAPEGMVLISAGEFQMGSDYGFSDEQPVHTVYVDAFYMDKYEVTNAQYKKFVLANPQWGKDRIEKRFYDGDYLKRWNGNDYPNGKANHPVVYVSWYAAMAYAQWAGKRLPTEAEWEKAARGGLADKKYPWGDGIESWRANYDSRTGDRTVWMSGFFVGEVKKYNDICIGDTTPVDQYLPNGYGLHDMAGNVWEWCLDEYNEDFYAISPHKNPLSGVNSVDWIMSNFTGVKTSRVLRGGSWVNHPRNVRGANRDGNTPLNAFLNVGFRCVRSQ